VLLQDGSSSPNSHFFKFLDLQNIERLVAYFVLKLKTTYPVKNTDSGHLTVLKNIFKSSRAGGGRDSRLGGGLQNGEHHNLKSLLKTNVLG